MLIERRVGKGAGNPATISRFLKKTQWVRGKRLSEDRVKLILNNATSFGVEHLGSEPCS
jgi:hypothetical protein